MSIHTEPVSSAEQHIPPAAIGQRVILPGVSWATYERLLADFQDSHTAHFTYDRGVLEIMVLSAKHENLNRTLSLLVEVIAEELEIDIARFGSTTFKRADLDKGFEPDSCYYIKNEEHVRGKEKIDLSVDPPPDLVIEIDITNPSLDKLPIYARVGVPEVWRYDARNLTIFQLEDEHYQTVENSLAFPVLTTEVTTGFLAVSTELKSTTWLRRVRKWAREQVESKDS